MTNKLYILLLCIVACVAVSCSTKKNTGATRAYHELTTRYNVEFNAKIAYEEGIKALNDGCVDDYSRILPMYPISIPENATKASSQMETTIEKCRKAIKNHSITKKPKRDRKRWKDPKYQYFYNQEEYVKGVKRAWILLGKAELHKGDFLGAASTFIYIARHYPSDVDVVCEARIWQSRAYAELGWMYNAEEAFDKIKEEDVPERLKGLYAATRADYLLKNNRPQEAYPFLKVAAEREKNRFFKMRFHYILGQIAMETGRPSDAYAWFKKVKKASPPYLMQFNTELSMLQAQTKNKSKAIKGLKRMAKSPNNMEYLDQIYYAIGNIYAAMGDTVEALDAYATGAELSTRNGIDKAVLLITKGDMHYGRKEYMDAHPCFEEATQLISATNPDYERVEKLGTTLGELAQNYNTVELQDSLQYLSTLSEAEQMTIIEKVIEEIKRQEEEEAKKAAEAEKRAEMLARRGMNNMGNIGPQGSQDWYFYNTAAVSRGKQDFQRQWGKRQLEDNWRRSNRTVLASLSDEAIDYEAEDSIRLAQERADSIAEALEAIPDSAQNDPHQREYYLKQIPFTPEAVAASDEIIKDGLYHAGLIEKDQLEDFALAAATLERLVRDYPDFSPMDDVYYNLFLLYSRWGRPAEAEQWRQRMATEYAGSALTTLVTDPDYERNARYGREIEDSLYTLAYDAYRRGDDARVVQLCDSTAQRFPTGLNRPKFLFLHALTGLRRGAAPDSLAAELKALVKNYPESDVSEMAGLIVKGIEEGRQLGTGLFDIGSIWARRTANQTAAADSAAAAGALSPDRDVPFVCLLAFPTDSVDADQLLYDLSRFNFAQFVVRNFDISRVSEPGIEQFRITGFNSFDEAHTYAQQLFADKALSAQLRRARTVLISDRNLQLLGTSYSFDDYARFYEEKFAPLHIKPELYLDAEGQEIRQIYEDELPEDYQPEPDEEEPVDDGGEWYEE